MEIDTGNFEVNVNKIWEDAVKNVAYDMKTEMIQRYAKLQSRKAFFRDCIRAEEEYIKELKSDINFHWTHADPDTELGPTHFQILKESRNELSKAKKLRKQLVELQLETKKEMLEVSWMIRDEWYNRP